MFPVNGRLILHILHVPAFRTEFLHEISAVSVYSYMAKRLKHIRGEAVNLERLKVETILPLPKLRTSRGGVQGIIWKMKIHDSLFFRDLATTNTFRTIAMRLGGRLIARTVENGFRLWMTKLPTKLPASKTTSCRLYISTEREQLIKRLRCGDSILFPSTDSAESFRKAAAALGFFGITRKEGEGRRFWRLPLDLQGQQTPSPAIEHGIPFEDEIQTKRSKFRMAVHNTTLTVSAETSKQVPG